MPPPAHLEVKVVVKVAVKLVVTMRRRALTCSRYKLVVKLVVNLVVKLVAKLVAKLVVKLVNATTSSHTRQTSSHPQQRLRSSTDELSPAAEAYSLCG
jgi:hypothetical protein